MANKVLQYFVVLFLLFSIIQSSYLFYKVDQITPSLSEGHKSTAGATGIVSLCLNNAPTINITCNPNANQSQIYSCQLNATDPDPSSGFTYSVLFPGEILFNVTPGGFLSFIPNNSQVGNHTINFSVRDNSSCSNNFDSDLFNLSILNANDAPYLSKTIPNISFEEEEIVSSFFLNNHFTDPDGDPMTYNVTGVDDAEITILNTSEVIINSEECGFQDLVIFVAKDPYNLTGISNAVIISCNEEDEITTGGGSTGGAGGGGGGGGGGLCKSNYECFEHRACTKNNTKIMRCVDLNGCEDEEYLTIECNYEDEQKKLCKEDWLCGDWGICTINNTRYKECIDLNQCDTFFDMPETEDSCNYIPTCKDGVKNGNEAGVDCGGDCPPCKKIETPSPIEEGPGIWTRLLIWIVMILLLSVLAYRYAHKEVYQIMAKLGLHFAGRVKKQIILDEKDALEMIQKVKEIKTKLGTLETSELTKKYVDIIKSYFFQTLGLSLDAEKEDLLAKFEERKLNEYLQKVLVSFFDKARDIEFSPQPLQRYEVMYLLEEMTELVLQSANISDNLDILEAHVTEYRIPEDFYPIEKIYLRLVNAYIALHFNELEKAIEKYQELLAFYETLSEHEEDRVYYEIGRLYQKLRYRVAWIENMG